MTPDLTNCYSLLAALTPSLTNFFYSLLAGTVIVVIPATVGLIFISQQDKVRR